VVQVLREVPGAVRRVVVHDDDLDLISEMLEDAGDRIEDVLALVERREHDRDARIGQGLRGFSGLGHRVPD
jgi:hypothetical protein